jgi:hypothetical protein
VNKNTSPSEEISGATSKKELLMGGPRFSGGPHGAAVVARVVIHMSKPPNPPARFESKKRVKPSAETSGRPSQAAVLTVGPRFCGGPNKSAVVALLLTQRSKSPNPPERLEQKKSDRSSGEIPGQASSDALLTVGPRGCGRPNDPEIVGRVVTQRSDPPNPPGLSEAQ